MVWVRCSRSTRAGTGDIDVTHDACSSFPEPIWEASAGVGLHLTDPWSTLVAPDQAGHCHGENGLVGNSSSEDSGSTQ